MKNMKKLIVASTALLAFSSALVGVANLDAVTAKAEGNMYIAGASVRLTDPNGIRFHTIVEGGAKEGYSYGTLLIPKADFTGTSLTIETPNVVDIPALNWKSETEFTASLGGLKTGGVIANFPKAQYNKEIYACSYAKDANGVYTYTTTETRTLAQVASISLTDTTEENKITDETARDYLESVCDYVLGADGFEFANATVELTVGKKLDLTSVFAENNGNEGLKAIWAVKDGADFVTVEKDDIGAITAIEAKSAGTVVLTATIGTKTAELTVNSAEEKTNYVLVNDFANKKWVPLANGGYVEEFQGKSGVTYISGTATVEGKPQGKGAFNNGTDFFVLDKSAYANCEKIVFTVWVEKSNVNLEVALTIDNAADTSNLVAQTVISPIGDKGGKWIEVELSIANILKKFDTCHNNIKLVTNCKVDVNHRTDNMSSEETSAKIYIDKVVAIPSVEVLCPACGSTEETHATCQWCGGSVCVGEHGGCQAAVEGVLVNDFANRSWVPAANGGYAEDFQGKSGVSYISGYAAANGAPNTKGAFNNGTEFFTLDKSAYANCKKIIFLVWVEKSNVNLEVGISIVNAADSGTLVGQTTISAIGDQGGKWIEVELDVSKILEKFDSCHNYIKLVTHCKVDAGHRSENMATEDISAKIYIDKVYCK